MLDTFKGATPEALAAIEEEKQIRQTDELFLLFAMGSQFDHLIYQALAKLGVYCLVADPVRVTAADVQTLNPTGIVLSGGPASVHSEPPAFNRTILNLGIPTLGICLGAQIMAQHLGGLVVNRGKGEFGTHTITASTPCLLLEGIGAGFDALQSHSDEILAGTAFVVHAHSDNETVAVISHGNLYGVQFHPEVTETTCGAKIFENFCFEICGAEQRYPAEDMAAKKIAELRTQIGDKKVLLALSGGSDSSTVAYLLKGATRGRDQLCGVYIRGIDRPDDEAFVLKHFGNQDWITLKVIDATEAFLEALAGKTSMKEKRQAVRVVYKPVLEEAAADFGASFIAQGTLYTDISESGGGHDSGARKARIKLHHNVDLGFCLPELKPLADCVKDSGRTIGRTLGVPEELLIRHPFPGPGLVVRIEDEITAEKLVMARELDGIYIEELRKSGLYDQVWQAGVVVTKSMHTYSKGDDSGDGPVIAFWAVWSVDGFTARAVDLPGEFKTLIAQRFGNEVPGIGAVTYRVSDKPFSTIEWG